MTFTTATLTIDAVALPADQIYGICTISRRENEASTMDITIKPPSGLQDLDVWRGKPITLDIDGVRAFTGKIDEPIINPIAKRITLSCNDQRREKLNNELAATIDTIGFYSDAFFPEVDNVIDELGQRLQTIPSAADIKPDGTYAITDINPKAIPDFTLVDADVYRRNPTVSITSRSRLTNQINLTFKFRYTRLRHRERGFKIEDLPFCDILDLGPLGSFTLKSTFMDYATSMDWLINDTSIIWEEMPASGDTNPPCTVSIIYVHDPRFATSMTYDSSQRFAQTITEQFDITIKAPQSIAQYGLIAWGQNNGYKVEFDPGDWEKYEEYSAPTGGISDPNDYYIDQDGLSANFDNAILTAINIAATTITKSHRDTQTDFETDLRLDFNLTHTIELNTNIFDTKTGSVIGFIDARGKITEIEHTIDFTNRRGKTTTEISQSTAQGTQIPDALTVPARPTVPVVADPFTEPFVMPIANDLIITPVIDDTSRKEQVVNQAVTYNLEIQNDPFGVTF